MSIIQAFGTRYTHATKDQIVSTVRFLLEHKADPQAKNNNLNTPLHLLLLSKDLTWWKPEIVAAILPLILEQNPDLTVYNEKFETPIRLLKTCLEHHPQIASQLTPQAISTIVAIKIPPIDNNKIRYATQQIMEKITRAIAKLLQGEGDDKPHLRKKIPQDEMEIEDKTNQFHNWCKRKISIAPIECFSAKN